jgi:hypothetical protein
MQRLGRAQAHARNHSKDIIGGSAHLHDEALRRHVERQERLIREEPFPELHSHAPRPVT